MAQTQTGAADTKIDHGFVCNKRFYAFTDDQVDLMNALERGKNVWVSVTVHPTGVSTVLKEYRNRNRPGIGQIPNDTTMDHVKSYFESKTNSTVLFMEPRRFCSTTQWERDLPAFIYMTIDELVARETLDIFDPVLFHRSNRTSETLVPFMGNKRVIVVTDHVPKYTLPSETWTIVEMNHKLPRQLDKQM